MQIDLKKLDEYVKNAPPYINGLTFVQSFVDDKDVEECVEECVESYVNCLNDKLRGMCDKYKGISFIFVMSDKKSDINIYKRTIKTGKRGRPKKITVGTKTNNHCHGLIVNQSEEINIKDVKKDLAKYLRKQKEKHKYLKQQKIKYIWSDGLPIVSYMDRQSNHKRKYGDFDFDYFLSPDYQPSHKD